MVRMNRKTGQMYNVRRKLGQGTFGVAWLVHTEEGKKLCLKEVRVPQEELKSAVDEANTMLTIGVHSGFVTCYDYWIEGTGKRSSLSILMEYCPNGTLEDMMRTMGQVPPDKVLYLLTKLLDALCYLHDKCGLVHRDIKPANIFLGQYGDPKLGDLGLAKRLTAKGGHTVCGTPLYMAPEILNYLPYGKAVDVWALGCTIGEMLNVNRPIWARNGDDMSDVVRRISNEKPTMHPPDGCPRNLVLLVEWMLLKRGRPTARQVLDHLEVQTPPNNKVLAQAYNLLFRPLEEAEDGEPEGPPPTEEELAGVRSVVVRLGETDGQLRPEAAVAAKVLPPAPVLLPNPVRKCWEKEDHKIQEIVDRAREIAAVEVIQRSFNRKQRAPAKAPPPARRLPPPPAANTPPKQGEEKRRPPAPARLPLPPAHFKAEGRPAVKPAGPVVGRPVTALPPVVTANDKFEKQSEEEQRAIAVIKKSFGRRAVPKRRPPVPISERPKWV